MKVKVKVESFKERLRLRWTTEGKRKSIALDLDDSPIARKFAMGRAGEIEADLTTGNYDATLRKYRTESVSHVELSAVKVFEKYRAHQQKTAQGRDMERYQTVSGKVSEYFQQRSVCDDADGFRRWMAETLSPLTVKGYLILVRSCWTWAIKQNIVTVNPWDEVVRRVKVPPQQRPRPFTQQEVAAILEGFKSSRYYCYYTDFLTVLFGTGCRTGEAIGLRWGHLSEGCTKVWIGESVSRGVRKSTKTNRSREFRLTPRLTAMLKSRCPENAKPDDLVFPAPNGGAIDGHNFRNRAWNRVLKDTGVNYRKPYNTRHTFISHALAQGSNPIVIAEMTGHDPEVLFKYYAADIQGGLQCPELFTEIQTP